MSIWNAGNFFLFLRFFCEIEMIPVKFLRNSYEICELQTSPKSVELLGPSHFKPEKKNAFTSLSFDSLQKRESVDRPTGRAISLFPV